MDSLAIIGGGAAGLMAGVAAGEAGIPAMILERRHRPGLKLLMCGNNRCNISHDAAAEEMLQDYGGEIGRFLKNAIDAFPPAYLRSWLQKHGLRTVVKRNRIYPIGENADDVLHLFMDQLRELKIPIALNCPVKSVSREEDGCWRLITENGLELRAKYILLATGGISYPKTGSVGDGQRIAAELGHKVTELRPGLAGMDTESPIFNGTREDNIEDATVTIRDASGRQIAVTHGNILCNGGILRGSAIFDAARQIAHAGIADFTASADLLPALSSRQQTGNLNAILSRCGFPQALARNVIGCFGRLPVAETIARLKDLPLKISGIRPVKEAIVTAGGVALDEIAPGTMESRIEPGLFFAGELLDIDGPTGGYNLHSAFATARLAVAEIARRIKGQAKPAQRKDRQGQGRRPEVENSQRHREERFSKGENPKNRYSDPRSSIWRGK